MITYSSMPNYIMRNIAGDNVLIKTQNSAVGNTDVFVFNDTGAFLWRSLSENRSRAQLASLLIGKYGIEQTQAVLDVDHFLDKCLAEGFISVNEEG